MAEPTTTEIETTKEDPPKPSLASLYGLDEPTKDDKPDDQTIDTTDLEGDQTTEQKIDEPAPEEDLKIGLSKEAVNQIAELQVQKQAQLQASQQEEQARLAQANQQLSPAQVEELIHPIKVDDAFMQTLGIEDSTPEQQALVQKGLVDKFSVHNSSVANLIAEVRVKELSDRLEEKFNPYIQYVDRQVAEQANLNFYNKYPGLEPYNQIVQSVATNVNQISNLSEAEQEARIVNGVTEIVKSSGLEIDVSKPLSTDGRANQNSDANGSDVPNMSTVNVSGRSTSEATKDDKPLTKNEIAARLYGVKVNPD